jgi:hypothetical protein
MQYHQFLPHHRATIERTIEHYRANPAYRALLIGGSQVKGYARPDSDIDIMLITTDEEWARLDGLREYTTYRPDLSTYEGGYVDGKFLNYQFLLDAAERGSEPTRWSFKDVIIAYSDIPDLENLLQNIALYPLAEKEAKIRSFYGQLFIMACYYATEAQKRDNTYLMTYAASNTVLYAARLVLAFNEMLYPYHKWLMTELEIVPNKPDNFVERLNDMLAAPSAEKGKALFDGLNAWHDWGVTIRDGVNAFTQDTERSWMRGFSAPGDM